MKKILIIMLLSLVLFLGCKKKDKKEVPDLNTENTEEMLADTVVTSNGEEETQEINEPSESYQDSKQNTYETPVKTHKKSEQKAEKKTGKYAVQLISLTDYDKILKIKRELAEDGYETELSTIKKNGKYFYRLRLKQKYSMEYARKMGEEIKNNSKYISGYWIQKTD